MLKIEALGAAEGVCPDCRGSGMVGPLDRPIEIGKFCSTCEAGARRWGKILEAVERANQRARPRLCRPSPTGDAEASSAMDWASCDAAERDGGKWLFVGTRVPVVALFENLENGASVDDFLARFPEVGRGNIEVVLEWASRGLGPGPE